MEELAKQAEPIAHTRWLVSADVDEHLEQLRTYLDYGFNHLVFHFPGEDQLAAIERYGKLILPRLRELYG
jgi:coenzyme F420-dependent glucose-6-phosphate dehydrogenase